MCFFKKVCFLFFTLFFINIESKADFVVVISKNSALESLNKKEISKLFLAKSKSLPTGIKAIPIELYDKRVQNDFYKIITNKSERQLLKYWAKMIFTGKGIPPKKFKAIGELINFIKSNKGAISYLHKKHISNDLKIIWEEK